MNTNNTDPPPPCDRCDRNETPDGIKNTVRPVTIADGFALQLCEQCRRELTVILLASIE